MPARDAKLLDSVVDAVGSTPLVELGRITKNESGRILAKLEYLNPGLSKKDRIARQILEEAEMDGSLKPGQTVVELTSGNTGTALAIVCAVKGHPFVAVMSRGNTPERARMMSALGAEVVLIDQAPESSLGKVTGEDLKLVEEATRKIVTDRRAFRADQFILKGNFRAHYLYTGPEIIGQTDGKIDAFCDFVGTGGTFAGCAAAFKEYNSKIKCYVVEPSGAAALAGERVGSPSHKIQGGGYSMPQLEMLNRNHVDGYLQVTDDMAVSMARRLAREEGIFTGFSTGANLAAALQLLQNQHRSQTIVIIACDSGLKYLSTDLWN